MSVNFSKNISLNIQPRAKSQVNSLFEVGLVIIICLLFGWFIILPKQSDVGQKKDTLAKVELEQNQMAGKLAALQSLISSLESNSQNVAKLDQALPLDGNVIRLRLLVQSLADSVGVTVGDINVSAQSGGLAAGNKALLADPYLAPRTLQTLSGTIYVIGSFNQLQSLLKKIETSGRLIDITTLAIDQGTTDKLNMRLTFKAYYLAP